MEKTGLYIIDYASLLKTGRLETYLIREAIVGVNKHIDYSDLMQRIAFQSDFDYIEICPLAHRNTINFFGIRPKSDYLVWYHDTEKGEFCAVDKTGLLTVWDTVTGKISEVMDHES